jgi:hypothetical protein
MAEDRTTNNIERRPATDSLEEHGIVHDVLVPAAIGIPPAIAAGATNAVVSNLLKRPKGNDKK